MPTVAGTAPAVLLAIITASASTMAISQWRHEAGVPAWRSAWSAGRAGLLEPGADPVVVRQSQVVADLQGLLPGLTGRWQVTGGLAGVAGACQQAGQPPAGQPGFPLAGGGRGLLVAGDRLAVLPEPGVHRAKRVPREGRIRGVASLRRRSYGLPGVAACEIVVPQTSVAFAEPGEGLPLLVSVASLAEQHQGLVR